MGDGTPDFYGPDLFLDHDVVIVTINYRLGALGFMTMGRWGSLPFPAKFATPPQNYPVPDCVSTPLNEVSRLYDFTFFCFFFPKFLF